MSYDMSNLVVIPKHIHNDFYVEQVFRKTTDGMVKIGYLVSLHNGKWGIELLDKNMITGINPDDFIGE